MINALCFDIDDLAYSLNVISGGSFSAEYLVEKEAYGLLEFLDKIMIKATMFVPGYVAEHFPALVKAMAAEGHEIASHGYRHIDARRLGKKEFRNDVVLSKKLLEDTSSAEVSVYKDPCWGITPHTHWAYDVLIEAGYRTDNTAQPALLKSLGRPSSEFMVPFRYKNALTVIPVTSYRLLKTFLPLNGGLFCAYIPVHIQISYYRKLNDRGIRFNYYCHPYELAPQGSNRHFWRRRSMRAKLYGMYFGIYRRYVSGLANHFSLAPLKVAYAECVGPALKGPEATLPGASVLQ
jgi:polysaccharide deacetylase family protein (PEP-CTERM system associated)